MSSLAALFIFPSHRPVPVTLLVPTEPTSISFDMLKTPEGQSNAVFACAGSALQHSQQFEEALVGFLLALSRLHIAPSDKRQREELAESLERSTLGHMLKRFRERVTADDSRLQDLMDIALEKRNYLAHRFFKERSSLLDNEAGRFERLHELVEIQALLDEAATLTRAMTIALNETLDCKREPSTTDSVFTIQVKT